GVALGTEAPEGLMNNSAADGKRRRGEGEKGRKGDRGDYPSPSPPFSPSQITVLIADDHPIFRKGLRQVIETDSHLKIVAEASDGEAAIAYLAELKPAVAVLDIDMPGKDGFAIADYVRAHDLTVEIIFLTMHADEQIFNTAL